MSFAVFSSVGARVSRKAFALINLVVLLSSFAILGLLILVHPDKNATHEISSMRLSFDRFHMSISIKNKELSSIA
jgi:hypothetical protein